MTRKLELHNAGGGTSMRAWIRAKSSQAFKANGVISGDRFRRIPIGCDSNHPLVEDLKLKDFLAMTTLSEEDACCSEFIDRRSLAKSSNGFPCASTRFSRAFRCTTRGQSICPARGAESRLPSSFGGLGACSCGRRLRCERCCRCASSWAACSAGTGLRRAPSRKASHSASQTISVSFSSWCWFPSR
jgi:Conserved hypothetical protein (DUF2461)